MAATTMHFGPEWMRTKSQTPARQQPPPSPPPPALSTAQQLGASTYSALVTPTVHEPEKRDESRPFRYSKEEMLRIYREGGGKGGLNLEVERWDGIVRDVGNEPAGLREMSEAEKKLFAGPLNSELRRRQSTDPINTLVSPSDRQRSNHPNSATGSPMRFGPLLGRRRDSTDQPPLGLPRKLSLSNTQGTALASPREALPSPRNRMGTFGTGFDGVLNGGDTWSRRRPSAGAAGAGGGPIARGEAKEEDTRPSEIKEEEESLGHDSANTRDNHPNTVEGQSTSPAPDAPPPVTLPNSQPPSSRLDSVAQGMVDMTMKERAGLDPNPQNLSINSLSSGPPPGLIDFASIEWSYLDPQGQVQGPFRADLMQKWFDEGYFTPDLLMKRTHIDTEWTPVRALEKHVDGGKIFLSQLPLSKGPPTLTMVMQADSPQSYSPVHEQGTFNGYQPVPMRTVRTATLDSYLNGPSPSESPSSSFSGGRFGNGSPDASSFGGRAGSNAYTGDSNFGNRAFGGRASFQDSIPDPRSLSNIAIGRAPSIDAFNNYSGGGLPWSAGPGQTGQPFSNHEQLHYSNGFGGMIGAAMPINRSHSINQEHFSDATYSNMGSLTNHHDSPVARQPTDTNGIPFDNTMINSISGSQFSASGQVPSSPSVPYTTPQHHLSVSTFVDTLPHSSEPPNAIQTPASAVQANNPSPWTTRSKSFDPPIAISPAVAPARPHASEWTTPQSAQPVEPSPWFVASLSTVDDVWREMPGPNSLTFSNLGQHNQLHRREEEGSNLVSSPIEDSPPPPSSSQIPDIDSSNAMSAAVTTITAQSLVPPPPTSSVAAVPKARRKSTAREAPATAPNVVVAPSVPTVVKHPIPPASSAIPPRPAWAVEEDSKKMSIREIQEAEAKKAEGRKAVEKERERIARANAATASVPEDTQPFIASWGLPTSQAGTRNLVSPKETSTIGTTSSVPVWTNASPAPTAKKTMKEIQEEEERRKKLAVKESMASAAARRAYAETTVKVVPGTQALGGAWTTVGSNGKGVPLAPPATRPAVGPAPSINPAPQAVASRPCGTAIRPAAIAAAKVVAPRVEDFPVTPSHDFLKWLSESLKGLNSSVNLEEITSMLLSFPLDPDESTIEIISDLVYSSSTTLDGRRFASEYVSKRKADAASRRGTASISGYNGKPASIAEVVKTQPKPVQQEWGFKVVNKKKKGGRS